MATLRKDVRLVVSVMGSDHSSETLRSPTLNQFTDALTDLYARLGCEASGKETRAETQDGEDWEIVHSLAPDEAPETVASELWDRLLAFGD